MGEARRVVTINSGSSSIKFSVYEIGNGGERNLVTGKLDGSTLHATDGEGRAIANQKLDLTDRHAAAGLLLQWLGDKHLLDGVAAVGYRIVHGGLHHTEPERLTPAVLEDLRQLAPLAPDHLPDQIAVVEAIGRFAPELEPVACFDTAFHRTMPRVAQLYGLTQELAEAGVLRYGFHGLSYEYLVGELRKEGTLPRRLIIAHLGNGASMAAIRDGRSVDTSMGMTPTGGFPMANRSGDLDPGVVLHLIRQRSMTPDDVNRLVTKDGGMKGLSGIGSDMRELEQAAMTDGRAAEAIDVFCYGIRKFLGAYIAALGGLDMFVFSGGIGENVALVRGKVCEGLEDLGIAIDAEANAHSAVVISRGAVAVCVMRTNEEVVIARSTGRVLSL